jgi:Helix-turn-helix domain/AccI restriction endonuclease
MPKRRPETDAIERVVAVEELAILEAIAGETAFDERTQKRAQLILAILRGGNRLSAASTLGVSRDTARGWARKFQENGWKALITVQAPRGGDFLARYDQGFWAERLTLACFEQNPIARPIPYGTSRSEPFTDLHTFRVYRETEFLLQAWSAMRHWKRPDLLLIPRDYLRTAHGNDAYTPDLKHADNDRCRPYVQQAKAAIEVETSLWVVSRALAAGVNLSFTIKNEDLQALRNWVADNGVPLFIVQVFYDQAYILAFSTVEEVIALPEEDDRHVAASVDPETNKSTYFVPLSEGRLLGTVEPEPEVEGRVFKAPNGRVTVYGRLTGSSIVVADEGILAQLAEGTLQTGREN